VIDRPLFAFPSSRPRAEDIVSASPARILRSELEEPLDLIGNAPDIPVQFI
jgi:hypothetical protein